MLIAALVLLVACDDGAPDRGELFPNTPAPTHAPGSFATPTLASPTPPALPAEPPPTSGSVSDDCVEGWRTPFAGSALEQHPLDVIARTVRLPDDRVVVDMRYFEGPESPPSEMGYLAVVERWYVKLYSPSDLTFQGRFLVESRDFGDGVAAVAPYDTEGFRSPDWSGFQWNEGEPQAHAYAGLPGRWRGDRYDFVKGGLGLHIPGLPAQVRGCLDTA
jgi:hypothetical protein